MQPLRFSRPALLAALVVLSPSLARAHSPRDEPSEDKPALPVDPSRGEEELYSLHFELTAATQWHPSFHSARPLVPGSNSLTSDAQAATAFVSTLYGDLRLWPGGELLFNPEMSGGQGLSGTHGVAAFPSGIVYRVGDPAPVVYIARLAISQTFNLGGGRVTNLAGPNELAGTRDRNVLAISLGRLSVTDVFDNNRYAADPSERFFNWALFASGAWDYPADTRGYTQGVLADLAIDWWSARLGIAMEPTTANGSKLDWNLVRSHGLMGEYEARYEINGQIGGTSLLGFFNQADMGSYSEVNADPAAVGNDIANTRKQGRTKFGFALSAEQQLIPGTGVFLRMSANDGRNESWAFTEIDRSIAFGIVQDGQLWRRPRDEAGLGVVVDALSSAHAHYLRGGGLGFILGDGYLNYAPEVVTDLYYKLWLANSICISGIYQPIINPGYNQDRGMVHVLTGRVHVAF